MEIDCKEKIKILIYWSGPYSYSDVINNINKGEEYYSKGEDRGIYQIYSSHPLYGDNVLTYIGKTDISFQSRLKDREIIKLNKDMNNVEIYLGTLYFDDIYLELKDEDIKKYISYAESLLINFHSPAKNSQNINSYKYWKKDITVINEGTYRMLQHEISTVGLYHNENSINQLEELKEKIESRINYKLSKYEDSSSYGYYLNLEKTLWLGFIYEYWNEKTMLILGTSYKIDGFTRNLEYDDWYYKAINGNKEEILNKVIKYIEMTN